MEHSRGFGQKQSKIWHPVVTCRKWQTTAGNMLVFPILMPGLSDFSLPSIGIFLLILGLIFFLFNHFRSDHDRKVVLSIADETITFCGKKAAENFCVFLAEVKNFRLRREKRSPQTHHPREQTEKDIWICEIIRKDGKTSLIEESSDKAYIHYTTELLVEKTGLACEDTTGSGLSKPAIRTYSRLNSGNVSSGPLPQSSAIQEKKLGRQYIYCWPKKQGSLVTIALWILDIVFISMLLFFTFIFTLGIVSAVGGILLIGITALPVWLMSKWLIVNHFGKDVIQVGNKEIRRYTDCLGRCLKMSRLHCYEIKSVGVASSGEGGSRLELTTIDGKTIALAEHSPGAGLLRKTDLHWLANRIQQLLNLQEAKK